MKVINVNSTIISEQIHSYQTLSFTEGGMHYNGLYSFRQEVCLRMKGLTRTHCFN